MSRTYRRDAVPLDCNCGSPIGGRWSWRIRGSFPTPEETQAEIDYANQQGIPPDRCCHCYTNQKYDFYTKRNRKRDKTGWLRHWGCSGENKRISSRILRAKQKNALVNGNYDIIPHLRKYDHWLLW